jgi:hypothetical protein
LLTYFRNRRRQKILNAFVADDVGELRRLFRCYINNFQKIHRAYERGAISERDWGYLASQAAAMYETPGGRIFVKGHEAVFQEFIDEVRRHHSKALVLDLSLGRERIGDA